MTARKPAKDYWVGYSKTTGIVLFDPSLQTSPRPKVVTLWVVKQKKLFKVEKSRVTSGFVPIAKSGLYQSKSEVDAEVARIRFEYEAEKKKRRLAVASAGKVRPRETYCHECKTILAADEHTKCLICGWLVCPSCGACGCDRRRGRPPGGSRY